MDKCRLVIIHWSIIFYIIFGIYYVSSAAVHSNNYNSSEIIKTTETEELSISLSSLSSPPSSSSSSSSSSTSSSSLLSSSSSLADILKITTESFCSHQIERYVQSEGKESSLIFELKPNLITYETCKRILIAPESHGFFIRLVPPKVKKTSSQSNSGLKSKHHGISKKLTNSTYSCPLSIFSANDPLTPWRIDPCQIELNNDVDEPVRLLQGRLRIVWDHGGNSPSSHLMITVLGKGIACQQSNKQPCLRFGTETLLCISKDLICDGIRHCPKGSNYDSDEDYEMCTKHKKNIYADYDSEAWDHLRIEIFRNLFSVEKSITSTTTAKTIAQTTMIKIDSISNNKNSNISNNVNKNNLKKSNSYDTEMHKNATRSTIAGDLSKYGPWGYLMLGMLLSGGALLICGLWECCCRQNKSDDTTITGSTLPGSGTNADIISSNETIQDISPPNYDELDPPPAYSVLFPNQKLSSCSSSLVTTQIAINESFNQHSTNVNNINSINTSNNNNNNNNSNNNNNNNNDLDS